MTQSIPILYCHCAYANVVPKDVKQEVLRQLTASGIEFDAVADLCEMSAKGDPLLGDWAKCGDLKIAACYPRAVKWLFSAAGAALPKVDGPTVVNMRTDTADEVVQALLNQVADGKSVAVDAQGEEH
jgi:hypothetical protein